MNLPSPSAGLRDGFAVGDLRLAGGGLDLELALHAVANDVEVEFAHAGKNGLAGVGIGRDAQGRILGHEALERGAHLFLVGLGVRLDRHRDDGLGEGRRLEADIEILVAQRVAGDDVLDADQRADVAGVGDVDFLAVDRAHQHEARNALGAAGARIVERHALAAACRCKRGRTRVLPTKGSFQSLNARPASLLLSSTTASTGLPSLVLPLHRRHIDRARQVIDDAIEQALHALLLEGGAGNHAGEIRAKSSPCGRRASARRRVIVVAVEIFFGDDVVEIADRLDQLLAIFLRLVEHVRPGSRS